MLSGAFLSVFLTSLASVYAGTDLIATYAGHTYSGCSAVDGVYATDSSINFPIATGVHFAADGTAYYTAEGCASVLKHDPNTNLVTRFAGTYPPTSGYTGDGGQATLAGLEHPQVSHTDPNNENLYICGFDFIRKVSIAHGTISHYAGTYSTGYNFVYTGTHGDGGPATSAQLNWCGGIFVNATNYVFFSDMYSAIRVISPNGLIHSFSGTHGTQSYAGGLVASALWKNPGSMWGNTDSLYVSDVGNCLIRRVDFATGTVSIAVGNTGTCTNGGNNGAVGLATVGSSTQVCGEDDDGNFFFTDTPANIRKVSSATDLISNYAGSTEAAFNGDWIAATSATFRHYQGACDVNDNKVYFAETDGHTWTDHNKIRVIYHDALMPSNAPTQAPSAFSCSCGCRQEFETHLVATSTKEDVTYNADCKSTTYTTTTTNIYTEYITTY